MTHNDIKRRYDGLQDVLSNCGISGCHFLTLCTIIEEVNERPLDLIDAIRVAQAREWFSSDFTGLDCIPFLEYFTGKKWTRDHVAVLPAKILANQFTETIYYNDRTDFNHFRRRYVDTKKNSVTVSEGRIDGYYIYTYK